MSEVQHPERAVSKQDLKDFYDGIRPYLGGGGGGASDLVDLGDVNIDNPSNNQLLKYNATTQKWVNANGGSGGADSLSDLDDVQLAELQNNQTLKWDATAEKWVNASGTVIEELGDIEDVTISSPTSGQTIKWNATSQKWMNGDIEIDKVADIGDVDVSSLTDGQVLSYDATSHKWINKAVSVEHINDVGDVNITSAANGQKLVYDSTSQKWINTNDKVGNLADVNISNLADKQILAYDNASQKWINKSSSVDHINDIGDVNISNVADNQHLKYDAASQKWVNDNLDLDDLHNVTIQSANDGQVLTYDATNQVWKNGNSQIIQMNVLPTPSSSLAGRIVQFTGTSPYINGYFYKCVEDSGSYNWVEWKVMRITGDTPMLVDVSGASVEREFRDVTIRWTDPADSTVGGQVVAEWGGTKLVRKEGSAPQNEEDGVLIINSTVRNQYSSDGYVDEGLEYGKVYYYRFFPYSTINVVTPGTSLNVNVQRALVPLPTQTVPLYYNNTTQRPTLSSEVGITKSGDTSGKDAGDYVMTLSLVSDDYRWSDGSSTDKTLTWTIQKAPATLTPPSAEIVVGDHETTATIRFNDLYDRTITSVSSSNPTIVTVSTNGETVSVTQASSGVTGEVTISVQTDSTSNANAASVSVGVKAAKQIIYGFQIDGDESDPSTMVSYLPGCDNASYTPAYMDYTNDTFNMGSWKNDEFFMPRPCMVKYDGTVDYYLNPNNYAKTIDNLDSDINDTSYPGNAMMEWGRDGQKIWYKVEPFNSGKSAKIYIANYQADPNYHDWSFHNSHSVSVDHFYTPIYNGSLVDGVLRSMSGKAVSKSMSGTQEIAAARGNNPSGSDEMWNIECLADRMLINFLLILMGKSCDTQTVFGKGACEGGSESVNDTFRTGQHNTKGLFYGTNSGSVSSYTFDNAVKVFGMENYYGFQWRRTNGCMYVSNEYKVKMTYGQEDGSTVDGYNETGNGYVSQGFGCGGTNGGYISEMKYTDYGQFGKTCSGSDSTYYTDAEWFANGTTFALFGGRSDGGAKVGALIANVAVPVSDRDWDIGAALSLKPLVEEG